MSGKLGVYFIFIKVTKCKKFTREMNQTTVLSLFLSTLLLQQPPKVWHRSLNHNIVTCMGVCLKNITGSRSDDWIYWCFLTITLPVTITYNSSQWVTA
jgi:hypothetical protein